MYPLDHFFGRGEVVDAVGRLEIFLGVLCRSLRLPIASILYEWYPISALLVSFFYENCLTLACYEDVF